MKSLLISLFFGLVGCATAYANDFATEMLDGTFKLFHPDSTATCFFITRPADKTLYLVTAAHTLERAKGETVIVVLREKKADDTYSRLDYTIHIRSGEKPLWVKHATEDIAVLRLTNATPVPVASLPLSSLCDGARLQKSKVHICSPVFVLTFPARFEGNEAGFPVARQGIISTHPFVPVQKYHTFLADFTTFAGDSGGPVFIRGTNGHPLILGMVLAQYRHDEQAEMEYVDISIHHPMGLGTVVHAQFIRETIDQASRQPSAK